MRSTRSVTDLAFVVGHGFTNHVRKPFVSRVLRRLAGHGGVVALDFRGHGRSGGASTVGGDEVHDLAAGVSLARELGYRRVVTVGFSMGASIALRHAGLHEDRPDAVAAVSAPSRWWVRETPAMRRVHWLLEQPHGRLAARALGVRLGAPWTTPPESPLEVVHRIAPTPLLIVHGEQDHYFGPAHAVALHRAAGGDAELWLEPGVRHAESAMTPALVDRIATWLDRRTSPEATHHATAEEGP
ncbi:alpha/beta hydrolase family protein [Saccharothrix sp. Mg75]|uniref:alpha/beta hydrolase family protein n=1 Tax=Saccharothrix sp. Mg75 TaxID=3445357 RepID=UPI003EEB4CA6